MADGDNVQTEPVGPEQQTAPAATGDLETLRKQVEQLEQDRSALTNNNRKLLDEKKSVQQQLDEMNETWGGKDPKIIQSLLEQIENDRDKREIAEGKFDEVIARKLQAKEADYQQRETTLREQLAERDDKLGEKDHRIRELMVRGEFAQVAANPKNGVQPTAMRDIEREAMDVYRFNEDGELVPLDKNGHVIYSKVDATMPMPPSEWLATQRDVSPHWFIASSGAGMQSGRRTEANIPNPYIQGTEHFNFENQLKLEKESPALAKQFQEEAKKARNAKRFGSETANKLAAGEQVAPQPIFPVGYQPASAKK